MTREFRLDEPLHEEYRSLGMSLRQLTLSDIAGKFEINKATITSIGQLEDDDLRLIRDLVKERYIMLARRKEIRRLLSRKQVQSEGLAS